jgi:hypothetical protein
MRPAPSRLCGVLSLNGCLEWAVCALRICGRAGKDMKIKMLASVLYFGALFTLAYPAHTQSLDGLSSDDRSSIGLACINAKVEGPATYHACLNRQLHELGNAQAPDLAGLSPDDRSSIGLACINAKVEGPATYHACLNRQLTALGSPPALSAIDGIKSTGQSGGPNTSAPSRLAPVPSPLCAENGSCYGDISARTGLPKTVSVHGYYRADGTYVRGYYRSK